MFNSRKTIAVKKHELEGLHQQLAALEQGYSATSTRLTQTTIPSKNYNNLKRQLQVFSEKIVEIAERHDNLGEEIFQLRLNELSDDIQQVIKRLITLGNCIALQTIEEAYRDVTQPAFPEAVRDLLLDLAEMAGEGEEDKNKPLWLFVNALRQKPSLIEYQKQELERLLQEHNILEALNVRNRTNASSFSEPTTFPRALDRVRQVKKQGLQMRLDAMVANYNAVSRQIEGEINAASRLRLERQLTAIAEEMDKIAIDIDKLGQ